MVQKTTQKILTILKDNPTISRANLAKLLNDITENGVKYQLKKMKQENLIRRVGSEVLNEANTTVKVSNQ